ncbi:MAG TPA: MBL fold metallo-hydrolase [Dehalococcoidales bacterium]|nr:MAG: hypothetical protein A2Z05_05820 [Chloroflexi bacterium RBG_16_60_22]HJX13907.1 MBL fold metallo-hydrolase [Dehalococcoidales bacterium]
MKKVAASVYVETGFRGCNASLVVTGEGVVMIDTPQVPAEARQWRDEITRHGEVVYLINTEPHGDHYSGNMFFGGTVVGHEGTREAIRTATVKQLEDMLRRVAPESLPLEKGFRFRPPTITLSQRLTLHLGDHTFRLINLPGHSPYQVAVFVPEERVVFTGDNVVNGTPPFMHQALPFEWLKTLDYLEKLEVDVIVPGHGEPCDQSYLPTMKATVRKWIDAVAAAIKQGMSLEEAQEKVAVIDLADERARMIQRMNIGHLYEVLKATPAR